MKLRRTYLIISIIAILLPMVLVFNAMSHVGWDFAIIPKEFKMFFSSVFGQLLVIGYFLSGVSLALFILYEAHARSDYYLYWALVPLIFIGVGVALPFYLYLRMPRKE